MTAGCHKAEPPAAPPPPPVVEVAAAATRDVPVYQEWIGTADGMVNATIRAQVSGYLVRQNYREGDSVKKGQVLFEIDARPFRATLEQARADYARQEAQYVAAKANLNRVRPLVAQNAVSQKDLDDAVAREQSAQASVQVARAAVTKAELDLGFTQISSPIDGVAGIAKAQLGNLVGPGATEELTTISTLDPIKVFVAISEQEYLRAAEHGGRADKLPLELILADGSRFPHPGSVSFADRQVDPRTGTIRVATLFPNPGNLIRPGQFARVRAQVRVEANAVVVPQRAVGELQGRHQVAVVGSDDTVRVRGVTVGERSGNQWIIREGLQPGERVVAEGTQKAGDGVKVSPKPFTAQPSP
jgi:membrane fusion protein (multidrug efflux system)